MLHNMGDANRILVVFSVALLIYANPALSQLGELNAQSWPMWKW